MNLGQALGELHLEIDRLEQRRSKRGAVDADPEAQLRGRDQQVAELRRKLDDALSSINLQAARIREIEARPPEIVEKPVPADCETCRDLREVLGRVMRIIEAPEARAVVVRATSYRTRMRETLMAAEGPMTAEEIAHATGIRAASVQTNIWHLVRDGTIARYGEPGGHGRKTGTYRYWLKERPLPEGVEA